MSLQVLTPVHEALINGIRFGVLNGSVTVGTRQATAQAQLTLNTAVASVGPGDTVEYRAGYNGRLSTIFVGEVQAEGVKYYPNQVDINCVGILDRTTRELGEPPLTGTEDVDADGNPIPLLRWPKSSTDTATYTDGQIITDILALYGITNVDIADAGIVLSSPDYVALYRTQTGISMIQEIDLYTGYRTFDGPDGKVYRRVFSGKPSASASLVLLEGRDLLDASRNLSSDQIINRVTITGRQTELLTPTATIQAPSRVNPRTGKPYIADPPKYRASNRRTDLLQTEQLCADAAARELGERNRLQESVNVTLPKGNVSLLPSTTCYLISSKLGFSTTSMFFVEEVSHSLGPNGMSTSLTLIGSYAAEGVNPNLAPIAAFTIVIDKELLADGTSMYTIMADGSMSYDPDGQFTIPGTPADPTNAIPGSPEVTYNGIAIYQWTSSLGVTPTVSAKGAKANFFTTADPTGQTITLTVYDNQGRVGTTTTIINPKVNSKVLTRDLWAAVDSITYFFDGQARVWNSVAVPAVGVCEQAADTYNLAWEGGGQLHKIVVAGDGTLTSTPIAGATDASSAYISWKAPNTIVDGKKAWYGGSAGDVYVSVDSANTFTKIGSLPSGGPVRFIQESPYAEGDVSAVAGRALWHSFDSGKTWAKVYEHSNTAITALGFVTGFDKGFIIFDTSTAPPSGEASRIQERQGLVKGDWNASSTTIAPPSGSYSISYSFRGDGGETTTSPTASVTLDGTQAASVASVGALPNGATGIHLYMSISPGSTTLRRAATASGQEAVVINQEPPAGAPLAPTANSTTLLLAPPSVAPTVTAVAAPSGQAVDKPVHPQGITMGVYEELLYTAGQAADLTNQVWKAPSDADFTFVRKTYDQTFGIPRHILRDGQFDTIIYGAADNKLFKTVDGFETTCYALKNLATGEAGKMLGYGRLRGQIASGNLIMSASINLADRSIATNNAIIALTPTGWVRRSYHPFPWDNTAYGGAGTSGDTAQLRRPLLVLGDGSLFTWAYKANPNYAADVTTAFRTAANTYRSTDAGVTWSVVSGITGVTSACVAPSDGTIYAVTNGGTVIQKSTDNGATWTSLLTFAHTSNTALWGGIAVASDSSGSVAAGWTGGVDVTSDGFASAPATIGPTTFAGVYPVQYLARLAGQRTSWLSNEDGNSFRSRYATDGALTGTLGASNLNYMHFRYLANLNALMATYGGYVYQSSDLGATWTIYYNGAVLNPPGSASSDPHVPVFDLVSGDQYLGWTGRIADNGGGNRFSIARLKQGADPAVPWENLTASLETALGLGWQPYIDGMVIGS